MHPSELYILEALLALPDGAPGVIEQGAGADLFTPGPARRVASVIFEQAAEGPVEPARVMGRLEDPAARALCGQLIGRIDTDKDYAREVEGWSTLRRRLIKRRRDELLRQIRAAGDEETRRQLLEQHKQLRDEPA